MGASNMMNIANTLVNVGYGEGLRSSFADLPSMLESSLTNDLQEEYIDQCSCDFVNEEMGVLNRKGGKISTRLYGNNEEFREEIMNFI